MNKLANKYKDISLEIIDKLKNKDIEYIEELLDERQNILDNITNKEEFKNLLLKEDILNLDKNIKLLIKENMDNIKKEIKEHNKAKKANFSYIGSVNKKLNIFNEKV